MNGVKFEIIKGDSIEHLNAIIIQYQDKFALDNFKVYFRSYEDNIALVRYDECE